MPTDCLASEGDLYRTTEVTVTRGHVIGVSEGHTHARVEHLTVAKWSETVTG